VKRTFAVLVTLEGRDVWLQVPALNLSQARLQAIRQLKAMYPGKKPSIVLIRPERRATA